MASPLLGIHYLFSSWNFKIILRIVSKDFQINWKQIKDSKIESKKNKNWKKIKSIKRFVKKLLKKVFISQFQNQDSSFPSPSLSFFAWTFLLLAFVGTQNGVVEGLFLELSLLIIGSFVLLYMSATISLEMSFYSCIYPSTYFTLLSLVLNHPQSVLMRQV